MTPEEVRAWAEQHRQRTIEKLEAQRQGNVVGFVFTHGVLLLGLPCGFLVTASQLLGNGKFNINFIYFAVGIWVGCGAFAGVAIWLSLRKTIERLKTTPLGIREHPRHKESALMKLLAMLAVGVPSYLSSRDHMDSVPFFCMLAISGMVLSVWALIHERRALDEAHAAGLEAAPSRHKKIGIARTAFYLTLGMFPVATGGWGLFVWLHVLCR